MTNSKKYTHRYLARLIIEAETPLAVGSGERDVMTDRLVATDVNGLPYIPGTALAGVLRNAMREVDKDDLFGFQKENDGQGSRLILSSAQMIGKNGKALDGLQNIDFSDEFYANFQNLPIRQHVRMSHKGAAEQGGKFDEQVVYKGSRFCFEMELVGNKNDEESWDKLLAEFNNPAFRLGGGTRKGFGAIKVEKVKSEILDLTNEEELNRYLDKTSELNDTFWDTIEGKTPENDETNWIKYELTLTPDDFFLFGSGFGSENGSADMSYVTERVIIWENGQAKFSEEKVLIPAASVKGALAHRTAFHFNKAQEVFADKIDEPGFCQSLLQKGYWIPEHCDHFKNNNKEDILKMIAEGNPAVRNLFGFSANNEDGQRGSVLFSDVFLSEKNENKQKLLNHVAIDRFTGGAMDGALFSEEVAANEEAFTLEIFVKNNIEKVFMKAFECGLDDLCNGMLPLGGGTMRGHGCFNGSWTKKNGEQ
jgi:CRISPR/Cas system CSM-associated protein Csm3 (group 7 of RAMP superfamily)